jgi:hypothetical protein
MASVAEPTKPLNKQEALVEAQLRLATNRVRGLDVMVASLATTAGVLAYAVGMIALDRWTELPLLARQVALSAFAVALALGVYLGIVRPLRRPVNPVYAAWQVEQVLPSAKNSIVNYVDLKDQSLPLGIRLALTNRAAQDISKVDIDRAFEDRNVVRLGVLIGLLMTGLLILIGWLGLEQFGSVAKRVFLPFSDQAILTRTRLQLLEPEGGNATIPVQQSVSVAVAVEGRNPRPTDADVVKLRLRYSDDATSYEDYPLEPDLDNPRLWRLRLPAYRVQAGFYYHLVGGDARLPAEGDYRISVRSTPLLTGFDVLYQYRPYLRWPDQRDTNPNIQGYRGTKVTLTAKTNRTVASGRLVFDDENEQPIIAERLADQPDALRFQFVLTKDTRYRIFFTSTDGETNGQPLPYPIKVFSDYAPVVTLTKPTEEVVQVPANGSLMIEALATDDFGLDKLTLKMQLRRPGEAKPVDLADLPYRAGKSFKRDSDSSYPRRIEYKQLLELDQLRLAGADPKAEPLQLAEKSEIDYYLEAVDNCDFPGPNVGKSNVQKIIVLPPHRDPEQKQQEQDKRNQDREQQKQHEQKQDEQNQNEDRTPQPPDREQAQPPQPKEEKQDKDKQDQQPKDKQDQQPKDKQDQQPKDKQDAKDKQDKQDANDKQDAKDKQDANDKQDKQDAKDKQEVKDKSGGMGEPKDPMPPKDKLDQQPKDKQDAKDKQEVKDKSGGMGEPKDPMPPKDKQDMKDKSGGMGEPKEPMPPKDKQDLKDKSGGMGEPKDPMPPKEKDTAPKQGAGDTDKQKQEDRDRELERKAQEIREKLEQRERKKEPEPVDVPKDPMPPKDKQDLKDQGGMGEPKEPMQPKDKLDAKDKQEVKDKSGGMGEPKEPMLPKDKQDLKDKSGGMGEPKEPMPPKDKQDLKDKSGGTPFDGGKDSAGKNASGKEEPMGTDPNKEFLDRSTELQLEKLRKVDPETLKDLKMTPEEYQEFLKSYEDLLKRRTAEREKLGQPGDKLGGRTGSSIVNKGASKIGGQPTQAGPAQGATITGAPPGFRDAQRQFSDAISRETPPPPRKR